MYLDRILWGIHFNLTIKGQSALVTGGSIGIGRAVSLALARCGAVVAFTYYAHRSEGEETRAAIRQMGRKAIAFQLDATNSRQVNDVVAPGLILETPFHETYTSGKVIAGVISSTPLKRGGTPEDVAHAVLYFVTHLGSFITGEIMDINGGAYFG